VRQDINTAAGSRNNKFRLRTQTTSVRAAQGHVPSLAISAQRFVVNALLKRVTNTQAAHLRRRAANLLSSGNPAPFLALVGVSLASGSGIITKQDELDCVCAEIRRAASKTLTKNDDTKNTADNDVIDTSHNHGWSLNDFVIGPVIAKGCSAVVHAAKMTMDGFTKMGATEVSAADSSLSAEDTRMEPVATSVARDRQESPTNQEPDYPLAVKMMFNYEAESNACAIFNAMHREVTPVPKEKMPDELIPLMHDGEGGKRSHLPAHPNIVETHLAFVDQIPSIDILDEAMSLYPDALPRRINPNGCGRNMSLFLVMKKYDCNLRQYLENQSNQQSTRTSLHNNKAWKSPLILLTQLLEGITHMVRHGIAHRDLKSDNLLIDGPDDSFPKLVISDFGCCLAGLKLPFTTWETDRGGNAALMAPEVATAQPGIFATINYGKTDVWTAGSLAYEMFGQPNPFYSRRLNSRTFRNVNDLPPLPDELPGAVTGLIREMLEPDPKKRISAEMAANICQLLLWMPSGWTTGGKRYPGTQDILQWLLTMTTKVLYESRFSNSSVAQHEYHLIATFLARFNLDDLLACVDWIHDHN